MSWDAHPSKCFGPTSAASIDNTVSRPFNWLSKKLGSLASHFQKTHERRRPASMQCYLAIATEQQSVDRLAN